MTNVDLFLKETLKWIFSGLNVNIYQCNVDPIGIIVQSESRSNHTKHLVENPEIVIHNSSFSSLDLNPGSKAQITDCYIDAQFKPRPTLITANNSDVSIQNCYFGNFINKNGSTILYGHNSSYIIIENSVFIQHKSSKGVLLLKNNSSMYINSLLLSENVASSPGYSAISLQLGIHAAVHNTVFSNNSAFRGGAVFARYQCEIALSNCNFTSNKAITGKTLNISKNSNLQKSVGDPEQNSIRKATPTLINLTSSYHKRPKTIATHSVLKKKSVQQEGTLLELYPGDGGAIYVGAQSQLLMTNCTLEDNSAQTWGGAILTEVNTMLHVQETTFVGNKAQYGGAICADQNAILQIEKTPFLGNKASGDGGAIIIQQQAQLRMKHCVFDDNISELLGGAIYAGNNAILDTQKTNFTGNRAALDGGAINIQQQAHLQMTNCAFDNNTSEEFGGAIYGAFDAILYVQETNFTHNSATVQGGAIEIQEQSYIRMTNCVFDKNIAEQLGGAISAAFNTTLEIQETNFTCNTAYDGGAIEVDQQSHLRMANCVFDDNTSDELGGAITTKGTTIEIQETNFTGNKAEGGGAINVQNSYLRITDCTFKVNRAKRIGGAIVGSFRTVVEISRSYVSNNSASQGGAINVQKQVNLSLSNCRLDYNFASDGGGAIIAWNSDLRITETNFTGNGASLQGGVLYSSEQTECYVVQCVFYHNTAKDSGGAVYLDLKSPLQVENTKFINNNATDGGAIFVQGSSNIEMDMCSFWKNFGNRYGGAIALNSYSTAVIENCDFLSNHAVIGGAVYVNNPEHLSLHRTLLLRNVASSMGGAISINNGADVMINNIICVGNQGKKGGGCLYIDSVTLTLNNSDISKNFVNELGAGVHTLYSRTQVGAKFTNETRFRLLNDKIYHKCLKCDSLPFDSTSKKNLISLKLPYSISCRFRECLVRDLCLVKTSAIIRKTSMNSKNCFL